MSELRWCRADSLAAFVVLVGGGLLLLGWQVNR